MLDKIVTFSKLTKKEMKHLKSQGMTTLTQFKATAAYQAQRRVELEAEGKGFLEPCYECKNIARRLGLPV